MSCIKVWKVVNIFLVIGKFNGAFMVRRLVIRVKLEVRVTWHWQAGFLMMVFELAVVLDEYPAVEWAMETSWMVFHQVLVNFANRQMLIAVMAEVFSLDARCHMTVADINFAAFRAFWRPVSVELVLVVS